MTKRKSRAEHIAEWKAARAEPAGPPLDPVVDALEQLAELPNAFRERAEQEDTRFRDATDSEYWVAVCFQTRAEKEAFLAAAGIPTDGRHIDGADLAKRMGVALKSRLPAWRDATIKQKLVDLT